MMEPRKRLVGRGDLVWVALVTVVCALFVVTLLRFLGHRQEVYRLGYEVAELTRQHSLLLEENRRLTVEAAVQSNAERLEHEALERLHLRQMRAEQVVDGATP
jgi:cell division protein FtsL